MEIQNNIASVESPLLAEYILEKHGSMSHLKLQKLLYLVEGYHLAYYGVSLIEDDFEAWTHGPVSRKIFDLLKDKSRIYADLRFVAEQGQPLPSQRMAQILTLDQLELIDEVLNIYDAESGLELEALTHSQDPWINARGGIPMFEKCTNVISKENMKAYFRKFVN